MLRYAIIAAILAVMMPSAVVLTSTPSVAVTAKDKMGTCKFGADDQKLQGARRAAFMKKCMSNKNDPRGPGPAVPPPPKS
jgi:hypothetical protein